MKATRRGILILGRTGLLGLAGTAFVVASQTGGDVLTGEAKKGKQSTGRSGRNGKQGSKSGNGQKGKKGSNNGGAQNAKQKSNTNKGQKKQQGQKKQRSNKNPSRHHGNKNRGKNKGSQQGIVLETGSLLPESLITEEAGKFSAHMLLPFEEFSSEAKLADAVAEAETLNLFILPEATAGDTASPAP